MPSNSSSAIKANKSGVGADAFVRPSGKAAVGLQTENKRLPFDDVTGRVAQRLWSNQASTRCGMRKITNTNAAIAITDS
jgi:hypothetical protein